MKHFFLSSTQHHFAFINNHFIDFKTIKCSHDVNYVSVLSWLYDVLDIIWASSPTFFLILHPPDTLALFVLCIIHITLFPAMLFFNAFHSSATFVLTTKCFLPYSWKWLLSEKVFHKKLYKNGLTDSLSISIKYIFSWLLKLRAIFC